MQIRTQPAMSCNRSHRSTRSILPTAPTTTVQSLQQVIEAYCRGAKAYMTLSWQSVMRSTPSGKSSSPLATVLLQTPCTSTTPPAHIQRRHQAAAWLADHGLQPQPWALTFSVWCLLTVKPSPDDARHAQQRVHTSRLQLSRVTHRQYSNTDRTHAYIQSSQNPA